MRKPDDRAGTSTSRTSTRAYHHGNLREELISVAIELVGARGVDGLSVAEAARQIGVSPGAPYRHFADREALLAAAVSAAAERLAEVYRTAIGTSEDPVEQLAAVSAAHVRLSAATGIGFEIIYASGLDPSEHDELAARTRDLSALTLPVVVALTRDNAQAIDLLGAQMALSHGYAGLLRSGFFAPSSDDPEFVAKSAAAATRVLLAGYHEPRGAQAT